MRKIMLLWLLVALLPLTLGQVSLERNHCSPVGCEQIYRVVSASPVQIQDNQNFKIEFEQLTGAMGKTNYYFGTETTQETTTPVYKSDCPLIKDVNGESHYSEKDCKQVFDYDKVDITKTISWQPGFYGKQVEAGKIHYIKVEMKKPAFQNLAVDVVLTFAGDKKSQWAWWNATWAFKQKVTLQTDTLGLSGNIATDHVILVDVNSENVDFWAGVAADGDDVRFTDAAEIVEYNYYFQDFNYAGQKMLAWVLVTDTFTSAADTEFYLYYGNAGAGKGEAPIATLAGLEAIYHSDDYGTGKDVNSANYDFNMVATNALIWDANNARTGDASLGINEQYYTSQTTLLDVVPAGIAISMWFRPNKVIDLGIVESHYLFDKRNVGAATDIIVGNFVSGSGTLKINPYVGGAQKIIETTQASWNEFEWYHLLFSWDTTRGAVLYINGSVDGSDAAATTLMANGAANDFFLGKNFNAAADFPGWIDELRIYNFGFTPSDANLMYNIENGTILTFGEQQIPGNLPDVNISKVEGFGLSAALPYFSYFADGNLAIDFNVFDLDNDRLTIDLNYHTSAERGTGTIIYRDLNLDSQFCTGLDWNETAVVCSVDFNIMGIGDNNFYLKILLKDSTESDFSSSGSTLGIDNNAPTIASYAPVANQSASTPTVSFVVELSDWSKPYRVYAGYYFNGSLDYNETKDVNAGNFALFSYPVLFAVNDSVYLVVNHVEDIAGNYGNTIQKTGSHIRTVLNPVDIENITTEDIERGTQAMLYNFFVKFGSASGFLVVLILALLLAFLVLKGATGG